MFLFRSARIFRHLIPILWLGMLMGYIWIGHSKVPFHGDEADHVFKSHDFVIAVVKGEPEKLKVTPPINIDSPEHIRLLTGTTTALFSGYALWSAGYSPEEWASPWYYGQDVAWNVENGRLPRQDMLHRGRVSTTILAMLSIPVAFGIIWMTYPLQHFRILSALCAATMIAIHPVWLLNSRRVMQEAALGTFSLMVVFCAIWYIQQRTWWKLGLLILSSGFCLAAKPTGAITILCVWAALGIINIQHGIQWQALIGLMVGGLLVIGMYIMLTPAIWGSPISRIKLATELRADILAGQTQASSNAYDSYAEQWLALIKQPFLSDLQYFESPAFGGFLDDQIADYEKAHLDGWQMPTVIGIIWTLIGIMGIGTLLPQWRHPNMMIMVFWIMGVGLAIGIAVPLAWQRYYLLWTLGMCLSAGVGFGQILSSVSTFYRKITHPEVALI